MPTDTCVSGGKRPPFTPIRNDALTLSIGAGENRASRRGLVAVDALSARAVLLQRNAAHGGAGFFLDFGFAFGASAPEGIGEAVFYRFLQFVVVFRVVRITFAKRQRFAVQRLLNFRKQFLDRSRQISKRRADFSFFAWTVATRQNRGLLGNVLWTKSARAGSVCIATSPLRLARFLPAPTESVNASFE